MKVEITQGDDHNYFAVEITSIEFPKLKIGSTYLFEHEFQANHIKSMIEHAFDMGKIEGMKLAFSSQLSQISRDS